MTFVSIFSILDGLQLTIGTVMTTYYGDRTTYVLVSEDAEMVHDSRIPRRVAEEYRQLPDVYSLSEEDLVAASYGGADIDVSGVDLEEIKPFYSLWSLDGREIEAQGECLVGRTLSLTAGILEGTSIPVAIEGKVFEFDVVGIFETKNGTVDAQILLQRDHLASMLPRFVANSSLLRIRILASEDIGPIIQFTEADHPELRFMESRQVSTFFKKSIINISRILSTIIVFVILLMVLGIYNSMNMVVSERTWEIGVIRAMGARRSFVLRLFVLESAMLSLLGGLFGVALGITMSHGITSFFALLVTGSTAIAPLTKLTTIWWGIAASIGIGLIGGMSPASRASRMEISEALSEG
jgi:putative ABC transport system permease protein